VRHSWAKKEMTISAYSEQEEGVGKGARQQVANVAVHQGHMDDTSEKGTRCRQIIARKDQSDDKSVNESARSPFLELKMGRRGSSWARS